MTYKTKKRSKKGKGIGKWVSKFTKKSKPIELPLSTIEQLELISRPINEVKKVFEVGQVVEHVSYFHDGRTYLRDVIKGQVVKVNRVTLDMQVSSGDIIRVDIKGIK